MLLDPHKGKVAKLDGLKHTREEMLHVQGTVLKNGP